MQRIAVAARRILLVLAVFGVISLIAMNYSFVFSRTVKGEVFEVERVTQPAAIIGGVPASAAQIYSFAIAIKEPTGEIVAASSEDRQWAVVKKGYCVEARFYPYPPWNIEKSGTYYNARMVKLMECKGQAAAESGFHQPETNTAPDREVQPAAPSGMSPEVSTGTSSEAASGEAASGRQ